MKIAVQGCSHGDLDIIYSTIEYIEKQNDIHIDLLLCCGDFQSSRNLEDVKCMAAPQKYQLLCSFYKYYSGEKTAPKLTLFIGGNHEASNYLQELPFGGWVAPNIYYLGYAGVVNIAGIKIAGLSGIFKGVDFSKGRYEKPPYDDESIRSCYHVRNLEIFRLKQLSSPLQVMMTHDWPGGIAQHGNVDQLLRYKPHLKEDIESDKLGNPAATELLTTLKPDYWFAAHLHAKFAALYKHNNDVNKGDETSKATRFLALDKCLPRKRFLQVLDIPHDPEKKFELSYDLEWLTILHLTNHLTSVKKLNTYMPGPGSGERWNFTPSEEEMKSILDKFQGNLVIPINFVQTAPPHEPNLNFESPMTMKVNPQTVEFCKKLGVDDPMELLQREKGFSRTSFGHSTSTFETSSFIGLSDSELEVSTSSNTPDAWPGRKRVSRTPLKLPTPRVQVQSGDKDYDLITSTPVSAKDADKAQPDSTNVVTSSNESDKDEASTATPKMFKRRNVSIYSNDNED